MWNIDDIEKGQLFMVEYHDIMAHEWDESQKELFRKCHRIPMGTCLFLVETYLRYEWEESLNTGFDAYSGYNLLRIPGGAASPKKTGTFHSFLWGEKVILLERADMYALELPEYSKRVQSVDEE